MNLKRKVLVYLLVIFHLSLCGSLLHAEVFCVDDSMDGLPNGSDCDANCSDGTQNCSLRDAIFASNGNGDTEIDDIVFQIPGTGPHKLNITATLPSINTPVNINGYSQPGSIPNSLEEGNNATLLIELDGSNVAPAPGGIKFGAGSSGSTLSGLVIHGFSSANLYLESSDNAIKGNFIGTTPEGDAAGDSKAQSYGIFGTGAKNTIGGTDAADKNIISGNPFIGIVFFGANAYNNAVLGNFIGTDATGQQSLGNGYSGIEITSGSSDNVIGGLTENEGNIIAFNQGVGVVISGSGAGNSILGNAIFSNTENVSFGSIGLGIDLNDDNVTTNDLQDIDDGPNRLQNFPILASAESDADGNIQIKGLLSSIPNTEFRIEFFANSGCDPSGNGEGESFIDALQALSTDVDGHANFEIVLTSEASGFVTATATAISTGDTSEFSPCIQILPAPLVEENGSEGQSADCQEISCQKPPLSFSSARGGACALSDETSASPHSLEAWFSYLLFGMALFVPSIGRAIQKN